MEPGCGLATSGENVSYIAIMGSRSVGLTGLLVEIEKGLQAKFSVIKEL